MIQTPQRKLTQGLEIAIPSNDSLGEGPWWSTHSQSLWRVDMVEKLVHRWQPRENTHRHWTLPDEVGCFVPNEDETMGVVALRDGLYLLDLDSGDLSQIVELESGDNDNQFNDGKCDREGNFWVGSKHVSNAKPSGNLYRVDVHGRSLAMMNQIGVSNGIGWSPDNSICYYTDSARQIIWSLVIANDGIVSREVFVKDTVGYPDGLTVDAEGCVWSAKWDGGRVVRYTPDGEIDFELKMPVARPTSVMFGGDDLRQLFITSAKSDIGTEVMAGHVFVYDSKTHGIAETPFNYSSSKKA
jgi:L-arabinonolactonase